MLGLAMRVWTTLGELVAAGLAVIFRDDPAALVGVPDNELHEGLA